MLSGIVSSEEELDYPNLEFVGKTDWGQPVCRKDARVSPRLGVACL